MSSRQPDPTQELLQIDFTLLDAWKNKTIKELHEMRDVLIGKINCIPKESRMFKNQLFQTLNDLETYIRIREDREQPDKHNNIVV